MECPYPRYACVASKNQTYLPDYIGQTFQPGFMINLKQGL